MEEEKDWARRAKFRAAAHENVTASPALATPKYANCRYFLSAASASKYCR
jgi:hypothetical protein